MRGTKKKPVVQKLLEQELALDDYLSTLLADMPSTETIEKQEQLLKPVVKPVDKPLKTPREQAAVESEEPVAVPVVDLAVPALKSLAIMPEYAQAEFSALFFKVGNLVLAAPLTDLLRTMKFDGEVTKIPQQPIWFMGLRAEQDKQVGILNMAYLVQGKSRAGSRSFEQQPLQNIILTLDGNWGLACDEVLSIAKILPDNVRWRTDRQTRPWLVGTVVDKLVAIVDINELVPKRKRKN